MDLIISSLPALWGGLGETLRLMLWSLGIGFVLSVPLAILWVEGPRPVRWLTSFYSTFFRGTPLLVQIFLIYYGLGQFEAVRDSFLWPALRQPFFCAVLALSLNTSGYTANIIRGAIQAVPFGEIAAARAFGMTRLQQYRHVILPQAFKRFLPAYSNEVIIILKATSQASTITLMELTGVTNNIMSMTYRPFEIFIAAALIYIAITFVLTQLFKLLEGRMSKDQQIIEW